MKDLNNLRYLELDNNQISDISSLSELKDLVGLTLNNNHISDIDALKNLTEIFMYLELYGNLIEDWSPISHINFCGGRP